MEADFEVVGVELESLVLLLRAAILGRVVVVGVEQLLRAGDDLLGARRQRLHLAAQRLTSHTRTHNTIRVIADEF